MKASAAVTVAAAGNSGAGYLLKMPGSTKTWLSAGYSLRAFIMQRRVVAFLLFVVAVQYVFIAFAVNRPYVTVTSPTTSSGAEQYAEINTRDLVGEKLVPSIAAEGRSVDASRSITSSPDDRHRKSNLFSILRERFVEIFSHILGRSALPSCPLPSSVPVELNWSIDDSSTTTDSSSNLDELDLNDVTSAEKVQDLLNASGRHLAENGVNMQLGGHWSPGNCTARHNIAVIVPYRGRPVHLDAFVNYIHPFLQRQLIEYTIYVVEQTPTSRFNRGLLLNVGFAQAKRLGRHQCYFFHDVDLLPESDLNLYTCPEQPRHVSAAVNTLSYRLPYMRIFGGVEAFKAEHFEMVNGFSNLFFGWGGEDDDLYQRVIFHRLNLTRYPMSIARYTMLKHRKDEPNPDRMKLLGTGLERMDVDGLNSLCYRMDAVDRLPLYTRLLVNIDENYHAVIDVTNTTIRQQCTYTATERTVLKGT